MTFLINPYTQENHDIVYDICLKTADSGEDASYLHEDPKLIGHYFAGPYINLEPESAFILKDRNSPCGYIIGALDSASFYKKMRGVWLPDIRKNYEDPTSNPDTWNKDEELIHLIFHPEEPVLFPAYPSHLHIDLLPRAQGQGQGKQMMDHFLKYLKKKGSKGVHLGLSVHNDRAFRFYEKYGLVELFRNKDTIFMGLSLD